MLTPASGRWKQRLYDIVYKDDTAAGKAFDIALLVAIVTSTLTVMLDSVDAYHLRYGHTFHHIEWAFTYLFTVEYLLRLVCIRRPWQYLFSPLGLIDLLAIVPSYLSIFYVGAQSLLVFRALRLLRIFRIFKLTRFLTEVHYLSSALKASARKISIFMLTVIALVIILGSVMYLVEKRENGFSSIPESIYWAIVTITTVGYGDIAPVTPLGKAVSSVVMLIGYGIIAVPTGIITTEIAQAAKRGARPARVCGRCGKEGHAAGARYCDRCGDVLDDGEDAVSG